MGGYVTDPVVATFSRPERTAGAQECVTVVNLHKKYVILQASLWHVSYTYTYTYSYSYTYTVSCQLHLHLRLHPTVDRTMGDRRPIVD